MVIVLGFDSSNNARAVEVEDGNREWIEGHFMSLGWTNLIFSEKNMYVK